LDRSEWLDKLPWGGRCFIPNEKYDKISIRLDRLGKFMGLIGCPLLLILYMITGYMFPTMMIKGGGFYIEGLFYQGYIPYFLYLLFWAGFVISYLLFIITVLLSFPFFARGGIGPFTFFIICLGVWCWLIFMVLRRYLGWR
jgi:hypothetical protein